jgi:hypothetical protein
MYLIHPRIWHMPVSTPTVTMAQVECLPGCAHERVLVYRSSEVNTIQEFRSKSLMECETLKAVCPLHYPHNWIRRPSAYPLVYLLTHHYQPDRGVTALIAAGWSLLELGLDITIDEFRIFVAVVIRQRDEVLMRLILDTVIDALRREQYIPSLYIYVSNGLGVPPRIAEIEFLWWCWQQLAQAGVNPYPVRLSHMYSKLTMDLRHFQYYIWQGIPLCLLLCQSVDALTAQPLELQKLVRLELDHTLGVRDALVAFGDSRHMRGPSRGTNLFQVEALRNLIVSYCIVDNPHIQHAAQCMHEYWERVTAQSNAFDSSRPGKRKRS